jgi:hypothetical protein
MVIVITLKHVVVTWSVVIGRSVGMGREFYLIHVPSPVLQYMLQSLLLHTEITSLRTSTSLQCIITLIHEVLDNVIFQTFLVVEGD